MTVSMHQFVVESLQDAKGRWPKIASDTGMSRRTIEKIARGTIKNPGIQSIEMLAAYFRDTNRGRRTMDQFGGVAG